MSMKKTELKETVLKALKTMDDEELCRIFNCFFQQLGTDDSIDVMNRFDTDFRYGYELTDIIEMLDDGFNTRNSFYAFSGTTIYSFDSVKDSSFFENNVDDVIDEVVEGWDALGNSTLDQILEEASR